MGYATSGAQRGGMETEPMSAETTGRAVVLTDHDFERWRREYSLGAGVCELPYGMERLEELGIDLVSPPTSTNRVVRKLRGYVEGHTGMRVEQSVRALPRIGDSRFVLSVLEPYGILPSMLKSRRIYPFASTPLAVVCCWLSESLRLADRQKRRAIARRFDAVDLITVWSENQIELFVDSGFRENQMLAIPFGVSTKYYTPANCERDIAVLAVGKDSGRDYATLLEAARSSAFEVDIVCRPENLEGLTIPSNVRVHLPVTHSEYRSMLRRAKVVVVPTRELAYPTGQSVALEASACGAAVVVTGTRPIREYFTDGENALLVPCGDPLQLRAAINSVLLDGRLRLTIGHGARRSVESRFTTELMWDAFFRAVDARGWL